jgi:hypothetical protein
VLFRVWYYLCFAVAPILFLLIPLGWLFTESAPLLAMASRVALVLFIALGVSGAVLGFLLLFCGLRLSCPFCGQPGEVCGSKEDGLGLVCERCGLVQGSGFLKLRLVRQWESGPPEETDDEE